MKVFLSSPFRAKDDDPAQLLDFRRELQFEARKLNIEVVLAEQHTVDVASDHLSHIEIVSKCGELVRDSDAFVSLVFSRHGSPLPIKGLDNADMASDVSIFETELLFASIAAKPMLVMRVVGHEPHSKLEKFLQFVKGTFHTELNCNQANILHEMVGWLKGLPPNMFIDKSVLFDRLLRMRQSAWVSEEVHNPRLLLLGGLHVLSSEGSPNYGLVRGAISAARTGTTEAGKSIHETTRLVLLWTAVRELLKGNSRDVMKEQASLWNDLLGAWASRAAWAGLKGPYLLGELAAVNANQWLRNTLGADAARLGLRPMFGARASALIGIVGFTGDKTERIRLLRTAYELCSEHIRILPANASGALTIRGAINRRLASEGQYLKAFSALRDYRRALRLAERAAASDSAVGQIMVELGFTQSNLIPSWGLRQMREGVALMEKDPIEARNRAPFLMDGKRKFAAQLRAAGRIADAEQQETEAEAVKQKHGIGR